MKHRFIGIALILICFLSVAALCGAQDDPVTQYLRSVSLFSPMASQSAKELIESGKPVPTDSASTLDPFPHIPHGQLEVPKGVRVMVFSPHPDDESIAASGLIQRVIENEGKVSVVFVTSGDGYKEALQLKIRNARISSKDFVEYGKARQEEAVQAACELGLQPEDATFLGFPDDGIDDLWEVYWSKLKPFISPHTLFDRPHRKGLNRWVKYSGIDLNQEIARVLTEFSPDWVVLPDPRDHHPDHATTGVFVLAALQNIYQGGKSPYTPTQVLTYLVHFRDYPLGAVWAKEVCASGVGRCSSSKQTLANSGWVSLALSAEELEGKRRAISAHASQFQMMQGFLKNFLLPREIFGRLNLTQVITVPQEYAAYFGHPVKPEEADTTNP